MGVKLYVTLRRDGSCMVSHIRLDRANDVPGLRSVFRQCWELDTLTPCHGTFWKARPRNGRGQTCLVGSGQGLNLLVVRFTIFQSVPRNLVSALNVWSMVADGALSKIFILETLGGAEGRIGGVTTS